MMDVVEMARRYAGYTIAIEQAESRMRDRASKSGPPPASAEFARLVTERTKLAHAIAEHSSRGLEPIAPAPLVNSWEPPKVSSDRSDEAAPPRGQKGSKRPAKEGFARPRDMR